MKSFKISDINTLKIKLIIEQIEKLIPVSFKNQLLNKEFLETQYFVLDLDVLYEMLTIDLKYLLHIGRVIKKYSRNKNKKIYIENYYIRCELNQETDVNYYSLFLVLVPNNSNLGNILSGIIIYRDGIKYRYQMKTTFHSIKSTLDEFYYS